MSAVVLDRDGTLIQCDSTAFMADARRVLGNSAARAIQRWYEECGAQAAEAPHREAELTRSFWSTYVSAEGGSQNDVDELCVITTQYHSIFTPYPDTAPFLSALASLDLPIGMLTNSKLPDTEGILRHVGIDPALFATIRIASPMSKPSPLAYRGVVDALGVPAAECLYVDDEPAMVQGALDFGMRAVLIDRTGKTGVPGITTLDDVFALLSPQAHAADRSPT